MRNRKDWMNSPSDPVLELLEESGLALSGGAIHHNLKCFSNNPPGKSTIYRALEPLEDHGYIEKSEESDSYCIITEKGRQYLAGELNASDLEENEGKLEG